MQERPSPFEQPYEEQADLFGYTGADTNANASDGPSAPSSSDAHAHAHAHAYDIMSTFPMQGDSDIVDATDAYNRRVILPLNISRPQAVATLNKRAQVNEYGFPTYFIRSDLLPSDLSLLTERAVEAASEGLFYNEGFPTLQNGTTFWHQLPHEPYEAYVLFMKYIEQAEEIGIRQIDLLAAAQNIEQSAIMAYFYEYCWSIRARCHDVFIVAADQKKRHLLTRKMENNHYTQAENLMAKLLQRFTGDYTDWIDELNAKEALEALEMLMKVQRMSLGLTGANASSTPKDRLPEGADTETVIRHITRGSGMTQQSEGSFIEKLRALTMDETDGLKVQEAILRIGYAGASDMSTDHMGLS